jgi:hypothetical protein
MFLSQSLQVLIYRSDFSFKKAELTKQAVEQEPMVVSNTPLQRQTQLRDLAPQPTESKIGQILHSALSADDRVQNCSTAFP